MLLLQANITNEDVTEHSFIFQVQVKNEAGVIVALAGSGGTIAAGGSMTPYVSWIPETAGTYTIEVCIWKSLSEPEPLSRALFDRKRTPVALLLAILAIAILLPASLRHSAAKRRSEHTSLQPSRFTVWYWSKHIRRPRKLHGNSLHLPVGADNLLPTGQLHGQSLLRWKHS